MNIFQAVVIWIRQYKQIRRVEGTRRFAARSATAMVKILSKQ